MKYDALSMPFSLPYSNVALPNRLVLAPMTTYSSTPDGLITPGELDYLRRRAAGGFGTIITAACYVDKAGQGFVGQWGCASDEHLPSLRQAAEAIKREGAIPLLQIHDAGRMSDPSVLNGPPRAPSAVAAPRPGMPTPRAMSTEEIEASIAAFASATRRACEAGYAGVEIHGANTYLLQQFFSPHSNRRSDEWGGSVEQRMRFCLEVVSAVREAAGPHAVVGYRFSPEEIEEPGITFEDTLELVDALSELQLDYLHVSLGQFNSGSLRKPEDTRSRTKLLSEHLGAALPLMTAGSIILPADAMAAMSDGASLIAIGRAALYEPEWAQKVRAGQHDLLRTCLPASGADKTLTLPEPLYERLIQRSGWIKICSED